MKLLFISHEPRLNGASKSLLNLIDYLHDKGYEIFVLTQYNKGKFYIELNKREFIHIIIEPYYYWRQRKTKLGWIKNKLLFPIYRNIINRISAKKVAKFAIEQSIDIIHSNTSTINIGAFISKYSGIPHVWHIREFGDLDFNMNFYQPSDKVYSFMNRYTNCFIFVSKAVSEHYDSLTESKKKVVYNGIDSNCINEIRHNNNSRIKILIAGVVYIGKGQDEAVAACNLLIKKGITNFDLYIAGEGKLYFEIENDLMSHVHVLGRVDDMIELRKNIDIELVCSRAEAFGRVTAEAMLSSIPVIGTNRGGTPELIRDGIDGFLYEKGDIQQLADKIETLIKDKSLRISMGQNGFEKAKNSYLIKHCADEIDKIYKEVSTR